MLHATVGTQTQGSRRRRTGGEVTAFHRDMPILEALARHPGAREVFARHGMNCSTCLGASTGTIEDGAVLHQVDPDALVEELNALEHSPARSL